MFVCRFVFLVLFVTYMFVSGTVSLTICMIGLFCFTDQHICIIQFHILVTDFVGLKQVNTVFVCSCVFFDTYCVNLYHDIASS